MILQDILNDLQLGEFADIALGDQANTTANLSKYIVLIQSGLTELHSTFLLKEKEIVIQPKAAKTLYPLRSEFAKTNTTSTEHKFIIDTIYEPMNYRVLQVLGVKDELGEDLPLNDSRVLGVFTPQVDVIQLAQPYEDVQLFVKVKADHATLTVEKGVNQQIDIPIGLKNALIWFVASRLWASKKDDASINKSVQYMQRFSDACSNASNAGVAESSDEVLFFNVPFGWR